jgi:hypothetical protein
VRALSSNTNPKPRMSLFASDQILIVERLCLHSQSRGKRLGPYRFNELHRLWRTCDLWFAAVLCMSDIDFFQLSPITPHPRASSQRTAESMCSSEARPSASVCGIAPVGVVLSLSIAICAPGCDRGNCFLPGECLCDAHFTGDLCDECSFGWTGTDCDQGRISPFCSILDPSI